MLWWAIVAYRQPGHDESVLRSEVKLFQLAMSGSYDPGAQQRAHPDRVRVRELPAVLCAGRRQRAAAGRRRRGLERRRRVLRLLVVQLLGSHRRRRPLVLLLLLLLLVQGQVRPMAVGDPARGAIIS